MGVYLPAQGSLQNEISRELPIRNVTLSNQTEKGELSEDKLKTRWSCCPGNQRELFRQKGAKTEWPIAPDVLDGN